MVHYAKVDRWVAALVGAVALFEFMLAVAFLVRGLISDNAETQPALTVGLILAGTGVLFLLILRGLYKICYEITSSDLIVRYWPFRSTVPLDSIWEVRPTRNPMSAPAPSLDRLEIKYRKKNRYRGLVLISPKDKESFVRDLAKAAPRLQSVGDEPLHLKVEEPAGPLTGGRERS
jgi:hypothetical protein